MCSRETGAATLDDAEDPLLVPLDQAESKSTPGEVAVQVGVHPDVEGMQRVQVNRCLLDGPELCFFFRCPSEMNASPRQPAQVRSYVGGVRTSPIKPVKEPQQ